MDNPQERNHGWMYWACWVLLAGAVYVGSSGPVVYCTLRYKTSHRFQETVSAIYTPMIYVPVINLPASMYCSWWTELALEQREAARIRKLPGPVP